MAKPDSTPADEPTPEVTAPVDAPLTRDQILAATEHTNAARALDGHRVVHVDPNATDGPEK